TNTIVAIKEIKKEPEDEEFLKREEQIFKELSETRHENLVWLIKSVDTQDHLYLIMEYCNFGDLDEYLYHRRRLDTDTLQHFFKQIAQALYVMTQLDIIHRDLKPQNILLCKPPDRIDPHPFEITIKVADFGVARFLNSHELAITLCGSPRYMAPEVLLELPYCHKVDLWSVGVMLYECAVGAVSFIRSNWSLNTLKNFYIEDGDLNLQVPLGTSKRLQELLHKLLVVDQKKRMDIDCFLTHQFFESDLNTMVVQSETPRSHRSPNTTFEDLDIGNSLLPLLLRVNKPSAPLDDDDENDKTLIAPRQVQIEDEKVLFQVIAQYTFKARIAEELSIEKDELLEILSISPDMPDFYKAKNLYGKIGYVPKNYVKVTIIERPKDNEKIGEPVKFRQEKKENEKAYQNLNIDEQIKSLPYFYEKMIRNECEQELNKRGNNGDFLLRESESKPGVYSLSVKYQPRNLHFTISKCEDESGKLLFGNNKFDSMNELIECYTKIRIYQLPGTHAQLFLRKPLLMIPEIPLHNDEHTWTISR
uniref:Uncharacterized protein n=1 Tax=Acrobeloides nanus TaxID=290746 RepID=A0A914DU92_9BILA